MYKKLLFAVALSVAAVAVSAQKLSGNLSPLKGQTEVNVVLDFTGTTVNGQPEENHIAFHTKGKNDEEKALFLKEWNEDLREKSYDLLIKDLNKYLIKKELTGGNFPNAEYTIIVKVLNISPGTHLMKNSDAKTNVKFVKTGDDSPFATVDFKKSIGPYSSYVAIQVPRTAMAFSMVGTQIGSTVVKNLK